MIILCEFCGPTFILSQEVFYLKLKLLPPPAEQVVYFSAIQLKNWMSFLIKQHPVSLILLFVIKLTHESQELSLVYKSYSWSISMPFDQRPSSFYYIFLLHLPLQIKLSRIYASGSKSVETEFFSFAIHSFARSVVGVSPANGLFPRALI